MGGRVFPHKAELFTITSQLWAAVKFTENPPQIRFTKSPPITGIADNRLVITVA